MCPNDCTAAPPRYQLHVSIAVSLRISVLGHLFRVPACWPLASPKNSQPRLTHSSTVPRRPSSPLNLTSQRKDLGKSRAGVENAGHETASPLSLSEAAETAAGHRIIIIVTVTTLRTKLA